MQDEWTWERIEAWHATNDQSFADEAKHNLKRRVIEISINVEKALDSDMLSPNDRNALKFAKQEIVPRWNELLKLLDEVREKDPILCQKLVRNIDNFTSGLIQGADKGGLTQSGYEFAKSKIEPALTEEVAKATRRKGTDEARRRAHANKSDHLRKRDTAILLALMMVPDADWDRANNYSIAVSVEDKTNEYFINLGGDKLFSYKTIQRWIVRNIRPDQPPDTLTERQ